MSTALQVRTSGVSRSFDNLRGDLIDGIAEAVASPPNPAARSLAISSIVSEIYETMLWMYGADAQNEELESLRRVLAEARDHQIRMGFVREPGAVARTLTA